MVWRQYSEVRTFGRMDKNMRILITGSTGLVGSEAVSFFTKKGWEVHGIDANMRSYFFGTPKKKPQHNIDIRNQAKVNALFKKFKFDAIIHAAAQPSHDWSQKDPLTDFDVNARGTLILLEATRKFCPKAVFVFVSSDKVYGENMYPYNGVEELATRYTANKHPFGGQYYFNEQLSIDRTKRSCFGCSKISADLYVQEYGYYFGMKTVCFRPGCITGKQHEGSVFHGFLANVARCIKTGETFHLSGFKGKQVRDNIHAYDLANAFYHFIKKPKVAAVYNIGGGEERSVSVLEAISSMEKQIGKKAIVEYHDKERQGDRIWDIHDITSFERDYPKWKFKYSLQDIIKELCE